MHASWKRALALPGSLATTSVKASIALSARPARYSAMAFWYSLLARSFLKSLEVRLQPAAAATASVRHNAA